MEKRDQHLIEKYLAADPELKRCMEQHEEYEKKLEEWNRRVYLPPEEEMERKRIQKLKLAGRDRIETILAKYRSQGQGSGG